MKKLLVLVIAAAFVGTAFSQEPGRAAAAAGSGAAPVAGRGMGGGRGPAVVPPRFIRTGL